MVFINIYIKFYFFIEIISVSQNFYILLQKFICSENVAKMNFLNIYNNTNLSINNSIFKNNNASG